MSNAVNVSLTRLREYERGHRRNYFVLFEITLFIIIIGLLLVTLGAGVNVYRNISDQRWEDEQTRTGLTLIANSVHITDTIDAVGVGEGPEGQALVLTETFSTGSYETRIYLYKGNIVEEYAIAGTAYTPERATALVQSDHFSFSYANGLLTVNTDHGNENILLHSVRKAGTGRNANTAANTAASNAETKSASDSEAESESASTGEDEAVVEDEDVAEAEGDNTAEDENEGLGTSENEAAIEGEGAEAESVEAEEVGEPNAA